MGHLRASTIAYSKRELLDTIQDLTDMCVRLERKASEISKKHRQIAKNFKSGADGIYLEPDDDPEDIQDDIDRLQGAVEDAMEDFRGELEQLEEDVFVG